MLQRVMLYFQEVFAPSAPRPSGACGPNSKILVGIAMVGLGLALSRRPLAAQSRGALQVAAAVLPAQPSRLALAWALADLRKVPAQSALPVLAAVNVESASTPSGAGAARRPPLVTISFVYN